VGPSCIHFIISWLNPKREEKISIKRTTVYLQNSGTEHTEKTFRIALEITLNARIQEVLENYQ